ncbi:MAG: response regulator [Bacilli bacterium]
MAHILIAEDELRMRTLLRDFLEREDYTIIEASNGQEALALFKQHPNIDLIILDIMMPELSGWDVCKEIRRTSNVPIMMLTAKGEEYDEIYGFKIGADDYVHKPFSPLILMARVEALLKRKQNQDTYQSESADSLHYEAIEMNRTSHIVTIAGEQVELSPKEYDLLAYFMENEGRVLSREMLLTNIWGYDYFGDARTVDTHINRLRLKLGDYESYLVTVRGRGYRFGGERT